MAQALTADGGCSMVQVVDAGMRNAMQIPFFHEDCRRLLLCAHMVVSWYVLTACDWQLQMLGNALT
jgi:hypothetical protein